MTEKEMRQQATVLALLNFSAHILNRLYTLEGLSEAEIAEFEKIFLEAYKNRPYPGVSPEISDMVSDEIHQTLQNILEGSRTERTWLSAASLRGKDDDI